MPAPSPNAKAVFDQAVELASATERRAYLDQACAADPEVRRKVEWLLQAYEQAGDFLEQPAVVAQVAQSAQSAVGDEAPIREGHGTVIGPYKLVEQIGEGGFGVVFLAVQQRPIHRKVAIKILKPGMDTRQIVGRFEAERQALALMDHANIAHVFDGGETAAGRPYFVMELVSGAPITVFAEQNCLSVRQRLELFVSLCQAVQHAHQKGIIHRDLKPSNVLVAWHDGVPMIKVIDFGIAKALGQPLTDKTVCTNVMQLLGTPMYTSPEQALLSAADVDTRADIYSLGVLLYELLTGTTPLVKERVRTVSYDELRRIIQEEEPPRPSERMTTVAQQGATTSTACGLAPNQMTQLLRGELDWIVMQALDKDRNRRYETASAFAADVQRYLRDETVLACPPSARYRLRKLLRRHKGPVLAASMVMLALLAGIIAATWGWIRASDARAATLRAANQKEEALKGKESALLLAQDREREANDQLFEALYNQARAGRFSRQMGQRLDTLDALAKAAGIRADERLRDEAMAAMALPDLRRGPSWQFPSVAITTTVDGFYRFYAFSEDRGVITVGKIPTGEVVSRIETNPSDRWVNLWLSPNGEFLAARDEKSNLRLWRVADALPLVDRGDALARCSCVAWAPNGRQLAAGCDDEVLVVDLYGARITSRCRVAAAAHCLDYNRDNHTLAVGYRDAAIVSTFDSAANGVLANLAVGRMAEVVVAWHPDGKRLAAAGSDPQIQIWDVPAKRRLATLAGHVQQVTMLNFHPDGGLLASGSWDGVVRLWQPTTGRSLMQMPLRAWARFSVDGRWFGPLYPGEQQQQLLEVASTPEYRTIVSSLGAGQGDYYLGDIRPDGRLFAVAMADATRLWDLATGEELATLTGAAEFVFFDRSGPEWDLLACGAVGFRRWPIARQNGSEQRLTIGPPQQLSSRTRAGFNRASDGRTLASLCSGTQPLQLVDLTHPGQPRELGPHPLASRMALSADGAWVASSGWHSDLVRLWDAKTAMLVREWKLGVENFVFFSPDSRMLIISRGESYEFWDVSSLQLIRRLRRDVALYPGYVAFSADGKLMALEMAPAVIHFKDVETGRTIAKVEDPHGDRATWMAFTPDGTKLVVVGVYARAVHVWDLRLIREQLKRMHLDWDWPEFPPAPRALTAPAPLTIEVRLGIRQLLGTFWR